VWERLSKALPGTFAEFWNANGFCSSFFKEPVDGRRVLLIWDEFDTYAAHIPLWSVILGTLKGLKALLPNQAPLLKVIFAPFLLQYGWFV